MSYLLDQLPAYTIFPQSIFLTRLLPGSLGALASPHTLPIPLGVSLISPHFTSSFLVILHLFDPPLHRAKNLVAFYGFLMMSNIAPHSSKTFSQHHHFLKQDVIFGPTGAHLILNWTKAMQDRKARHIIHLPVEALGVLLRSRNLEPQNSLFASIKPPYKPIIDTHIRDVRRHILIQRNISPTSHSCHL